MGRSEQGREDLVLEATSRTALRKGDWVMIPPYGGRPVNTQVNIELGNSTDFMLFNLRDDPGQKNNLAGSETVKLQEMIAAFESIRGEDYKKIQSLDLE